VLKNKYCLVILDSFSSRSIEVKCKIAPKVSFIGMFGYFNGPEVNRVLFSFHRMNNLLGYSMSEKDINSYAKASMVISEVDQEVINQINLPDKYIAIVLGGEWNYRTYKNWDKVIENILKRSNNLNIVLIGSDNANSIAKKIFSRFPNNNIFNCVAKYSFNQTAQIISLADIIFCCDGGLMHAANSLNKTTIPLLARLTPEMQLTDCINAFPLFDDLDVNNIATIDIIDKYYEVISFVDNHLQDE
jgi:heptosyltransferase-2